MAGLSQHLFALGRPTLERQLAHPTVRGIAAGDLELPRFRAFVGDLGRGLDELAGAPSPALAQRLALLFARAARFELAFWEMCWSGQAWPG